MRRLVTATATLLVAVAPATVAAKPPEDSGPDWCAKQQNVHANPSSRIVEEQYACYSKAGAGAVRADFDGDGFGDLAVGVPDENVNDIVDAGIVHVIYGGADGLGARNDVLRELSTVAAPGDTPEAGDKFGSALAGGDFNGDGFADLAVGAPFEDVGTVADAGMVLVYYGSPTGIVFPAQSGVRPTVWTQNSGGVPDAAEAGDQFGFSLAWGDFGGGPEADLAVGVPGESLAGSVSPIIEAGAGNVINGPGAGPTRSGGPFWAQGPPGSPRHAGSVHR